MSFPPGTEMFQFPGFARNLLFDSEISYFLLITEVRNHPRLRADRGQTNPIQSLTWFVPLVSKSRNSVIGSGFPHSEIHGSKLLRSYPWLIAA